MHLSDVENRSNLVSATALWFPKAGACELCEEILAPLEENEVLVRTLYSGISRGTEALVFNDRVPESERERMRGPHMAGDFSFPVKYGYCAVGSIEAGPEQLLGKQVFCLHPHQTRFVADSAMVRVLPDGLPPARAVLAANMETALNIVWDANVLPGDRVAVFGAGVVGALVAFIASRIAGTEVTLVDRNASRRDLAKKLGLEFAQSGALVGEFDILINASASGDALAEALDHAGQEARIVEASWYGQAQVSLPLGGAFHSRRLRLVSSQVGSIPASRRARWDFGRRLAKAMELLKEDCLDVLISGETDFRDITETYPFIIASPETLCHRIFY